MTLLLAVAIMAPHSFASVNINPSFPTLISQSNQAQVRELEKNLESIDRLIHDNQDDIHEAMLKALRDAALQNTDLVFKERIRKMIEAVEKLGKAYEASKSFSDGEFLIAMQRVGELAAKLWPNKAPGGKAVKAGAFGLKTFFKLYEAQSLRERQRNLAEARMRAQQALDRVLAKATEAERAREWSKILTNLRGSSSSERAAFAKALKDYGIKKVDLLKAVVKDQPKGLQLVNPADVSDISKIPGINPDFIASLKRQWELIARMNRGENVGNALIAANKYSDGSYINIMGSSRGLSIFGANESSRTVGGDKPNSLTDKNRGSTTFVKFPTLKDRSGRDVLVRGIERVFPDGSILLYDARPLVAVWNKGAITMLGEHIFRQNLTRYDSEEGFYNISVCATRGTEMLVDSLLPTSFNNEAGDGQRKFFLVDIRSKALTPIDLGNAYGRPFWLLQNNVIGVEKWDEGRQVHSVLLKNGEEIAVIPENYVAWSNGSCGYFDDKAAFYGRPAILKDDRFIELPLVPGSKTGAAVVPLGGNRFVGFGIVNLDKGGDYKPCEWVSGSVKALPLPEKTWTPWQVGSRWKEAGGGWVGADNQGRPYAAMTINGRHQGVRVYRFNATRSWTLVADSDKILQSLGFRDAGWPNYRAPGFVSRIEVTGAGDIVIAYQTGGFIVVKP